MDGCDVDMDVDGLGVPIGHKSQDILSLARHLDTGYWKSITGTDMDRKLGWPSKDSPSLGTTSFCIQQRNVT
jgi:hypothetical protein